MKNHKLIFIILISLFNLLFGFEVEFTKVYTQYIVPKKEAVFIQTKADNLTFPFKYIKTKNGYILIGNINQINMWLNNDFYAPDDAQFKNIKISVINSDKLQYRIIKKISQTYKKCKIKQMIFLSPDENKIITKPTFLKEKYKIILNCK